MPHTEEYLRRVNVGNLVPHDGPVLLAEHNESWALAFETLAERIRSALGARALLLEHVGSTAVPGLAAKPIIDIALAVESPADEASYVPALVARGFELKLREPDWYQHRLLKARDIAANLHVFAPGCEEIARMVAFRERLRTHEGDRREYERVKRELAARTWRHIQDYADAKSDVVRAILARCGVNR